MIYRTFKDLEISAFGFGAMRLPAVSGEGDAAVPDLEQTEAMIDYALQHGVNYFDTGWDYHNGESEVVLGRFLAQHPRDSYFYADKFPGYNLDNFGKVDQVFEAQLERAGLDHFDFYLLHNVCELNIEHYLDDARHHTVSRILQLKEQGAIGHFGISTHGNLNTMRRILDRYGDVIEFCQIQLNWLDWEFQEAGKKVELLNKLDIPIVVMEPLRGGSLATLSDEHLERLGQLRPGVSAAEWGFRYLQDIPGIVTVLSGASSLRQLEQDIAWFEHMAPVTAPERDVLHDIARQKVAVGAVPCTACRYCTSHCPQGLDIPGLITLWNEHAYTGSKRDFIAPMALGGMPPEKRPSACVGCGACAAVCPQNIDIPAVLQHFAEEVKPTGAE